jgi:hypothetical protein
MADGFPHVNSLFAKMRLRLFGKRGTIILEVQMNQESVKEMIQKEKDRLDSWAKVAKKIGISQPYLHDIMNGRRTCGPKVLQYFGLEMVCEIRKVKK